MTTISNKSRIIVALASLSLLVTYFIPIWRIDLFAPQYPEGLTMKIWLKTLTGDVEIINGLNHYIGMRHISVEMFPEFAIMVYIVGFYILLGLLVAWSGRLAILFWYLVFTAFGGAFSMFDFYRWGYDYGHNLAEDAAIKVPGLSYQPPLIGHKRLLNFDAYSQPDFGGWIIVIAAAIMAAVWFYEYYLHHKLHKTATAVVLLAILGSAASCTPKPEPFKYGTDICHACKMGIMDPKFGSELVTKKGRVYKFDDIGCMVRLMKAETEFSPEKLSHILVADFERENHLIDVHLATFVQGADVKSPMNYNVAGFSDRTSANQFTTSIERKILDWNEVYSRIE